MSIIWQGEKWICFCLSFFYLVSPLLKVVVFANNVNILSWKHPGTTCIFFKINYYLCWYFYCVNTKWQWVLERCTHSFFKNKVPFHKQRKAQFFFLLWLASDMVDLAQSLGLIIMHGLCVSGHVVRQNFEAQTNSEKWDILSHLGRSFWKWASCQ